MLDGMLYAAMVGLGETFFVADAARLGASTAELGLVVGLPLAVGSVGPLVMLALLRRFGRRRPLVAACTFAQTLLLCGIPLLDRLGSDRIAGFITAVCLYQVFGQGAGTAWASWYGDLVPASVRGRYFGRRTAYIQLTTFLGSLAAGATLRFLEPEPAGTNAMGVSGAGFQVIFGAAAVSRLISTCILLASPEPAFRGIPAPLKVLRFLRTSRGTNAQRLVIAASTVNLLVYVSSPYFQPFMLKELHFSYSDFTIAQAFLFGLKVLFLRPWGRAIDTYGARQVFTLSALMVSLVPLPWLWTNGVGWAVIAQAYSGFSWGGYEVSLFAMMLGVSYRKTRPILFAAHSMLNGGAQLLGTFLGSLVFLVAGESASTYRWAFAISMVGRLAVGALVGRLLPDSKEIEPVGRTQLLLRVIGVRPSGGLVHRPLLEGDEDEPPAR